MPNELNTFLWAMPTPTILAILLATGWIVTKREHSNMVKLMEYFRDLSDEREGTVKNQAETIHTLSKAVEVTTQVVDTVREVAGDRRKET